MYNLTFDACSRGTVTSHNDFEWKHKKQKNQSRIRSKLLFISVTLSYTRNPCLIIYEESLESSLIIDS